jgi:uncharacterized protein (DUF302 family)
MAGYGITKQVDTSYEQVLAALPDLLKAEGFGVLTEIDVQATLKKKLDVDVPRYVILGACNPPFAHRALQAEPEVGLLLPCNVVVYEDAAGKTTVSAVDPVAMMGSAGNPVLADLAVQVRAKLERVIAGVL